MGTQSYYPEINNPSTSYGYYGGPQRQQYVPNYYPDDSSDEGPTGSYQHQKMPNMSHNYYEPMFHPPSSLYYSHNYPRHSVEPGPPTNPAPSHSLTHQSSWYQQPMGSQPEQMMSMVQYTSSNGREARNRAEKNRRDKLNGSIQELSTMVPHVAESPRRVDKTAVLRFSAHGLRLQYIFGKTLSATPFVKPQVTEAFTRLIDSFLLTVTCRGQIVLISPSVEQHLGHCQTDLFGQNILHITHPDDHPMLKKQLIPTDVEKLFDIHPEDDSGEPRPRTQAEEDEIDRKLREDKRLFSVRLARAGPRSEPTTYELVQIDGCFRRADSAPRGVKTSTFPSGLQLIRRARGRDDSIPLHTISGNDIVLVGLARVIKPPKCDRMMEPNHGEYQTRHLIDGRIIECDQRISLVAGYMTEEVNGLSPFSFMHQDDVRWVIVALRQMYDCNSEYGESCYRLMTRNGEFVYLRTRGYMEIDKQTNVVRTFLCINTLLNEEEGKRRVQEMKNKLTVIVNTTIPSTPSIDAPAAESPIQLEKAIIYLIQNLRRSEEDDEDDTESRVSNPESESEGNRHAKSPPLALIPPKHASIKSSIKHSVDVVNITVTRSLRAHQRSPARIEEIHSPTGKSEKVSNQTRPSVLQKSSSSSIEPNGFKSKEDKGPNSASSSSSNSSSTIPKPSNSPESRVPPLPSSKGYFDLDAQFPTPRASQDGHVSSPTRFPFPSTVLKRTRSNDETGDENSSEPKRRTIEIEKLSFLDQAMQDISNSSTDLSQVLVNSFVEIDQSLNHIDNVVSQLQDQRSAFPVDPSSQHQIEEIMEERLEQRDMLENIKNEYEAHIHRVTDQDIPAIAETDSCPQEELKPR